MRRKGARSVGWAGVGGAERAGASGARRGSVGSDSDGSVDGVKFLVEVLDHVDD